MEKEKVKKMVLEEGLTLENVIDAVIEVNGFVGVGLVSLSEYAAEYIRNKIKIQFSDN